MTFLGLMMAACVATSPAMAQTGQAADASSETLARQIADATFQPEKAYGDALANFDRQFDAGSKRAAAGRATTAAQSARLARIKAAGHAELGRQLKADAIPAGMETIEAEYRSNYTVAELREVAAFWTSAAGHALTIEAQAAGLRGGAVTPPPAFTGEITRYFASSVGLKEAGRRGVGQAQLATAMSAAMQRAMGKAEAAMSSAANAKP